MSILIKGFDMPKTCDDCIVPLSKCDFLQRRADDCPLVEIPTPHGRLVDADEFKSWVDDWYDCTDIGNIVESWIDERPTILEAEE